uniref:HicB family protein n=1 Tax=Candidatus Kentrum sp. DK TaxID=2126562 RepID=A0A450TBG9_9GAMM|nr:MAG: hypothetical protein BECKDK2373B_GA0170837_108612 [Candidatus Kentron sp. DK]VFJ64118.1 MAG: hypothetical protein BECKDK2373C_GA0170839_111413 [Candidatus Kentron sp. DK]
MTDMAHYALQVPEPLFVHAHKIAEEEHISTNEFFVAAIAEKVSFFKTNAYFRERRARGDLSGFDVWLAASPDVPATAEDELR